MRLSNEYRIDNIIRARKALAESTEIDVHVPDNIENVSFSFADGTTCSSIAEWFSDSRERGLEDIKLSVPEKEIERHPFGAAYEHTDIVCLWKDDKVSRFVRNENWKDGKGTIEFKEIHFDGEYKELVSVENNTEEYKQVLLELKALAEKIKYEHFARAFDTAYRILDGTATPNHDNAPYYIKDLSDDLKDIMLARNVSYVFGGMGSWNDEPQGASQEMGLRDEYERLTNALIMNLRKALFYVINTCFLN